MIGEKKKKFENTITITGLPLVRYYSRFSLFFFFRKSFTISHFFYQIVHFFYLTVLRL